MSAVAREEFFEGGLEEFKCQVAKFLKRVDAEEARDRLNLAWKAVCLFYLNLRCEDWERVVAVSYWQYAARRYSEIIA